MKKGLLVLVLAIYFVSFFAGVKIKPKESRDTRIANLREYVIKYNGAQKHRDLIKPGEAYYFPTVKPGYERDTYSDPHLLMDVYHRDSFTKMSAVWLYGASLPSLPDNGTVISDPKSTPPSFSSVGSDGIAKSFRFDWFWPFIIFFVLFLVTFCLMTWRIFQKEEEKRKIAEAIEKERKDMEREIEEMKKKLPVVPPVLSNERWLRENSPVELTHNFDDQGNWVPTASTVERVFGKKPDLIAYALVSTKESAVNMEFSNERHANTGLSKVAVWLGYNWDELKSEWTEVGMIASICANGFEMNPEKVKKIGLLFTSVELVDKTKNPVLSCDKKVPEGTLYPELVAGLVVKYLTPAIADLRKAGATVEIPQTPKKGKK